MTTIDKQQFGPWALITGASAGIGEEFARQLAAGGFDLVLVARRKELLEHLGQELKQKHRINYAVIEADLSTSAGVEKVIEGTDGLNIGLLISNAGTGKPGKFLSFGLDHLMATIQLNALSHIALTHHFGRKMAAAGKGGILLTGAMGAIDGLPYMANESGTKAMVQALAKALNTELKATGIHITVLVTSPTETPVLPLLGFTKDNLPMKPLSVQQCVSEALEALRKNRPSVLPGLKYRMMNTVVPASFSRAMMAKVFKKNNNID
ncbi:SDR family NAD(P)-dependent oxidoreductase [uncultured Imperialibacter sp.]|uniref:SDR family NAD(P)-dependent oxidoreductase n=1 Tax=uncultured Imperialibacter sp. TaxID=1672639 RepID=UPI0030D92670|tara:strand:- start:42 stop:836 length:795 start_codon:yes stop_codon:yes gene_type:complete